MISEFLKKHIKSQASYVEYGYGQVEPNHLSAQRTAQIYAQLPADPTIKVLEQGQYVKYDYAKGVVDFTGEGEWMLVYNETKLYHDNQSDCEFAMVKGDYKASIYSPKGNAQPDAQSRFYKDTVAVGSDYRVPDITDDPFHIYDRSKEVKMPEGTTMVPRVFKTNVGDIYTTNTINAETLSVGDVLTPGTDGILAVAGEEDTGMKWQVVKVYTMPDHQRGVKIMRIA